MTTPTVIIGIGILMLIAGIDAGVLVFVFGVGLMAGILVAQEIEEKGSSPRSPMSE